MQVKTTTTGSTKEFNSWYDKTSEKVLNLNLSDGDLIKFIGNEMNDKNLSEGRRQALEMLIEKRSRVSLVMSNMLKVLAETARAVISNIRP